jgi:hypothetical protein
MVVVPAAMLAHHVRNSDLQEPPGKTLCITMRLSRGLSPDFDGRLSGWYSRACSPLSRCQETLNLDAHRKRATVPVFSAPADSTSLSLLRSAVAPSVHLIHRFCCEYPIFLFLPTITSCVRVNALEGGKWTHVGQDTSAQDSVWRVAHPPPATFISRKGEKSAVVSLVYLHNRGHCLWHCSHSSPLA